MKNKMDEIEDKIETKSIDSNILSKNKKNISSLSFNEYST